MLIKTANAAKEPLSVIDQAMYGKLDISNGGFILFADF